jgi:hypothetical protein
MSSACDDDAPARSKWRCRVSSPRSLKKGRLQRPLGGKIAPKPDKVTVCLATPLHNFPDRESFLPGRHFFMVPPGATLPCASAAVPASSCCERNGFHLPGRFPSGTGPLIDCGCLHAFLYPSQAGCATNVRKRAAPNPYKKDMLRSPRTMRLCSVGCASLSQDGPPRVRNGAYSAQRLRQLRSAAHARPIRLVNEAAQQDRVGPGIRY